MIAPNLLPLTAEGNHGAVDLTELAEEFGTPLHVHHSQHSAAADTSVF